MAKRWKYEMSVREEELDCEDDVTDEVPSKTSYPSLEKGSVKIQVTHTAPTSP